MTIPRPKNNKVLIAGLLFIILIIEVVYGRWGDLIILLIFLSIIPGVILGTYLARSHINNLKVYIMGNVGVGVFTSLLFVVSTAFYSSFLERKYKFVQAFELLFSHIYKFSREQNIEVYLFIAGMSFFHLIMALILRKVIISKRLLK